MMSQGEIVVLTGAAGCIGYHTLKLLINSDEKVTDIRCLDLRDPEELMRKEIDNELTEYERKSSRTKRVNWFKGDIRDVNTVEQVISGADCIIHCAARVQLWRSLNEEQEVKEFYSINVDGTEILLKAAIELGVSRFVHVSSFEIYASYDTIYYATETTLPEIKWFLYGSSAQSKKDAEFKVRHYSNSKLNRMSRDGRDSLNAVIIRFPFCYGEFERCYVPRILEMAKFFNGKLQRFDNIWIRQQPIYAANAAWALIKAKDRMLVDQSISGEEFHITDETPILDPFDFLIPFLDSKGMRVSKETYQFLPVFLILQFLMLFTKLVYKLDVFGLLSNHKGRLQDELEKDGKQSHLKEKKKRWYDYYTIQYLCTMCTSNFLNRTKASLRLGYEPLINPDEALKRSVDWCREHVDVK